MSLENDAPFCPPRFTTWHALIGPRAMRSESQPFPNTGLANSPADIAGGGGRGGRGAVEEGREVERGDEAEGEREKPMEVTLPTVVDWDLVQP